MPSLCTSARVVSVIPLHPRVCVFVCARACVCLSSAIRARQPARCTPWPAQLTCGLPLIFILNLFCQGQNTAGELGLNLDDHGERKSVHHPSFFLLFPLLAAEDVHIHKHVHAHAQNNARVRARAHTHTHTHTDAHTGCPASARTLAQSVRPRARTHATPAHTLTSVAPDPHTHLCYLVV